jgi:hypothetical protein
MPPGKAEVELKEKPSTFTSGVAFYVTFALRNLGKDDLIYLDVYNRETGLAVRQYSEWMTAGSSLRVSLRMTVTQDSTFKAVAKAGHLVDSTEIVDDQVFFEIPIYVPPECSPDGKTEILEYCPDGYTVKRERKCENGKWKEYSYTCPAVGCPEGNIEPLEYCPDGTLKRYRKCENGVWKEYTNVCPPVAECTEGASEVLELCPDGITVKRERKCENGKWKEYTYECPVTPPAGECEEGSAEILELCSDGYTVKRERRCEGGKWVYYDYTCPEAHAPPVEESILEMILRMVRERLGLE